MDANTKWLLEKLNKELGRNRYDGVERQLEEDGHIFIRSDEKETVRSAEIVRELEDKGWFVAGCDKGTIVEPPAAN